MVANDYTDLLQSPSETEVSLVASQPLFAEASRAELRAIADGSRRRFYRRGEVIYQQDDLASSLFILLEGLAKVELVANDGRRLSVGWLGRGSLLGTMSLIDGQSRQESAVAASTCEVLVLNLEEVRSYIQAHSAAAWSVLQLLATRWRLMTTVLSDITFLDIQARIAKTLLKFLARGVCIEHLQDGDALKLSQTDLATLAGTTRETVNRCLHKLQRQGILRLDRRGIVVLQPEELRRRLP